jgi:hypothetical protein
MYRKLNYSIYFLVVLILAAGVPAAAVVPIEVENFSFEDPNIDKIIGWDMEDGAHYESYEGGAPAEVPGWESDGAIKDSGVETGWDPTDGLWTGFIMAGDPSAYNLTNFPIQPGDVFELKVDAQNNWEATDFQISLYYDDNGTRITLGTDTVTLGSSMQEFLLSVSADEDPNCYNHEIGIELNNVSSDATSWIGLDNVRLTLTSPLNRAYTPYPEHKGFYEGASVHLTWIQGPGVSFVDNYHVYISNKLEDVKSGAPAADEGPVSDPNYEYGPLVQGDTYYWRIDTNSVGTIYRGSIWSFTCKPLIAYEPDPASGSRYVPVEPSLSWHAGTAALDGHVVIFGDSFSEVYDAPVGTTGPFRVYLTDVSDTNCTPAETGYLSPLDVNVPYYWRVDTVESESENIIHKGDVWDFTTVPIAGLGSITREVWEDVSGDAIRDLTGNADYPDNPSTTNYPTSFDAPRRWSTDYGTRMHGWLYVETTADYTFWIAADNVGELWLDDNMIASTGDASPGYHVWNDYSEQQSESIHLEAENLYYIMALQKQGDDDEDHLAVAWSTSDDYTTAMIIPGINLLPFEMYARVWAFQPYLANGATETRIGPELNWKPGVYADKHDVYFGTDFNDVNDADTSSAGIYKGRQSDTIYVPGILEFNTTYYWRIDEVNDAHPDKLWKGTVWNFTTGKYLIVDDFEDYNDYQPDRIFDTWIDGWGVTANGSQVGYSDPPFAEQTIVHSGSQSMPFSYDNTAGITYSEAVRTFDNPQDWTRDNVQTLTLFFRGYPAAFVEEPTGTYTMAAAGSDVWGESDEFRYAYKMLLGDGSISARVVSVENTSTWAKAGVMIRETLDDYSTHGFMFITPENRRAFQNRPEVGYDSFSAHGEPNSITLPGWVRLVRQGNNITAYYSEDGINWIQQPDDENTGDDASPNPQSIVMRQDIYIGMALCSHNANAICTAVFSDLDTTGAVSGDWQVEAIGIEMPANDPAQFYITVEGGGTEKIIEHPDNPDAVLTIDWQRWDIPLSILRDAGVDLTSVDKMIIGVGSQTDPQDGEGRLYFDDIRLYTLP